MASFPKDAQPIEKRLSLPLISASTIQNKSISVRKATSCSLVPAANATAIGSMIFIVPAKKIVQAAE